MKGQCYIADALSDEETFILDVLILILQLTVTVHEKKKMGP